MTLVMTLLARDEADVIESWLSFHLNAGADFVIATDNKSVDGTSEVLERYAREGHVHLIREPGEDLRQNEWVTRMSSGGPAGRRSGTSSGGSRRGTGQSAPSCVSSFHVRTGRARSASG
jgi:hypothetical protein